MKGFPYQDFIFLGLKGFDEINRRGLLDKNATKDKFGWKKYARIQNIMGTGNSKLHGEHGLYLLNETEHI